MSEAHASSSTLQRLIHQVNEASKFFASQKHDAAVAGTANHVALYWDPRMREMIFAHVKMGGEGLTPLALEALEGLAKKQAAA
jgi:formate dehydrogenase subunit delta